MKKFRQFIDKYLPKLWGICWIVIITAASFGLALQFSIWVFRMIRGMF